jgi:hypothetical protein
MSRFALAVLGLVCATSASAGGGDLLQEQLSRHVRQSVIKRLTNDAQQAPTQPVEAFAEYVVQHGLACFRFASASTRPEAVDLFEQSLLKQANVFQSKGWGDTIDKVARERLGIRKEGVECKGPNFQSDECKAIFAYLDATMNLYSIFARCLTNAARQYTRETK